MAKSTRGRLGVAYAMCGLLPRPNIEWMRILKDCMAKLNTISAAQQESAGEDAKAKMRGDAYRFVEKHQ